MLSFDFEPTLSKEDAKLSHFTDGENDEFISHRTISSNTVYEGLDNFSKQFEGNFDKDTLKVSNEIYNYVLNSKEYIKNIIETSICKDFVLTPNDVKSVINFYSNSLIEKRYNYFIYAAQYVFECIVKDLKILNNGLINLNHAYYLAETTTEQNDVITDFYNAIGDVRKFVLVSMGEMIENEDDYKQNPLQDNIETSFNSFICGDTNSFINSLNPYLKNFYTSKIFSDIQKGKIKPGDKINNAILILYLLFNTTIEKYVRAIYDYIMICEDLYEYTNDRTKPVYIPLCYSDFVEIKELYNTDIVSTESEDDADNIKEDVKIDENYKKKSSQLYKIYLHTIKLTKYSIGRYFASKFFKKYYGRIPELYEQYSNDEDAVLAENKLNGDPVTLLKDTGVKYIQVLSKEAADLFNEIIQLSNKVGDASEYEAKLQIIKGFCKHRPFKEDEPKELRNSIRDEARFRIAESIFKNMKIYGYTPEGIVQNGKFPPANHIVVSIFTLNPHEKPFPQKIGEIFDSADSLLEFAKPDFGKFFNDEFKKSSSNIMSSLNVKGIHQTNSVLSKSYATYKVNIAQKIKSGAVHKDDNLKESDKYVKLINKGLADAISVVWDQKQRCLQCISCMLDMTKRISFLAKKAVVVLLNIEKKYKDKNYKTGFNAENTDRTHHGTQKDIVNGMGGPEREKKKFEEAADNYKKKTKSGQKLFNTFFD